MPTVHPLVRGKSFTLSDTELKDDALCDWLNMPSLAATAVHAANIHNTAELLGFAIGSGITCLSPGSCGNFACLRCRRIGQEDYVMRLAPLFIDEAWRRLSGLEQAEPPMAVTIAPAALRYPSLDCGVSLGENCFDCAAIHDVSVRVVFSPAARRAAFARRLARLHSSTDRASGPASLTRSSALAERPEASA